MITKVSLVDFFFKEFLGEIEVVDLENEVFLEKRIEIKKEGLINRKQKV